ncbi:MAG: hypothetical protein PHD74_10390, partial [Candidatus Krumholzibacteria bacterium]|nr:hypothetical protein [Candidatus Krumholzibacteria bacterium]
AKLSPRYTGLAFFLAMDAQQHTRIDAQVQFEPDDELIELLQCGLSRRFDKIKDFLVSVVDKGIKRIGEKKTAAPTQSAGAQAAETASRDDLSSVTPGASAAGKDAKPSSKGAAKASRRAVDDDSTESILEALSEIPSVEDDSL